MPGTTSGSQLARKPNPQNPANARRGIAAPSRRAIHIASFMVAAPPELEHWFPNFKARNRDRISRSLTERKTFCNTMTGEVVYFTEMQPLVLLDRDRHERQKPHRGPRCQPGRGLAKYRAASRGGGHGGPRAASRSALHRGCNLNRSSAKIRSAETRPLPRHPSKRAHRTDPARRSLGRARPITAPVRKSRRAQVDSLVGSVLDRSRVFRGLSRQTRAARSLVGSPPTAKPAPLRLTEKVYVGILAIANFPRRTGLDLFRIAEPMGRL